MVRRVRVGVGCIYVVASGVPCHASLTPRWCFLDVARSPPHLFVWPSTGEVSFLTTVTEMDDWGNKFDADRKLATVGQGQNFGEVALLFDAPRAATCRVESHFGETAIWALDRLARGPPGGDAPRCHAKLHVCACML